MDILLCLGRRIQLLVRILETLMRDIALTEAFYLYRGTVLISFSLK
jgi:hypothetical protein